VLVTLGITMMSAGARAQGEGWWIVRAEYGTRSQRNDVTDILKDLIARGGVNGRVAVNHQIMAEIQRLAQTRRCTFWPETREMISANSNTERVGLCRLRCSTCAGTIAATIGRTVRRITQPRRGGISRACASSARTKDPRKNNFTD
jgi:hypothetical protein